MRRAVPFICAASLVSACGGAGGGSPTAASPVVASVITLSSQPGDHVGGGQPRRFTPSNSTINAFADCDSNRVHITVGPMSNHWSLYFAAPRGRRLLAGTYEAAERYPFEAPGRPGMDISGEGRGCNRVAGRFVVHEALFAPDGAVERFRADFEQRCETWMPPLTGEVRLAAVPPGDARISFGCPG